MNLNKYLEQKSKLVDQALNRYLPKSTTSPTLIHKAMRYSIFAGGKRLRPVLTMAAAELCGGSARAVLPTACALELIHTYSLIHDDLPAMDNDDLRRGRPTNHIVFGDDMAILAGDALLTLAFDWITKNTHVKSIQSGKVLRVLSCISHASGSFGMIGGQVADIKSDKGLWKKKSRRFEKQNPKDLLEYIHLRKTAALIIVSLEAGALLAGGTPKQIAALKNYGKYLGLAFQVQDDILDRVGDKKKLGKRGSDAANQKLTYPALYGMDTSRALLNKFVRQAKAALSIFGARASVLTELANFVSERDH